MKVLFLADRTYKGTRAPYVGVEFVELTLLNLDTKKTFRYSLSKENAQRLGFEQPSAERVIECVTEEGDNMRLVIKSISYVGNVVMTLDV